MHSKRSNQETHLARFLSPQDVNDEYSVRYPKLYTPGHLDLLFNKKVFGQSVAEGIITSLVLFFIPYGAFHDAVKPDGTDLVGHKAFGCVVASILIVAVTLRVSKAIKHKTRLTACHWNASGVVVRDGALLDKGVSIRWTQVEGGGLSCMHSVGKGIFIVCFLAVQEHVMFQHKENSVHCFLFPQCALDTAYWTGFNHVVVWGSIFFYFGFTFVFYSDLFGYEYMGVARNVMSTANFWFTLILTVTVLLVPVVAERFYYIDTRPTLTDKVRLKQKISKTKSKSGEFILRRHSTMRRSQRSLYRSGYAFAHQEGFGRLITSGTNMPRSRRVGSAGAHEVAAELSCLC